MRNLTQEEIDLALDDNGEADEGCIAIESNFLELADKKTGTCCGYDGNQCFTTFSLLVNRKIRGWYNPKNNEMCGMIHIQSLMKGDEAEKEADHIVELAGKAEGSLRNSGPSLWEGFWEFEIE